MSEGSLVLQVEPQSVGIPGDGINCEGVFPDGTSVCHVTLTAAGAGAAPLHWFARSDPDTEFRPSSGDLNPEQSVDVTITTKFCGGYRKFYFQGPANVAIVTFQCG